MNDDTIHRTHLASQPMSSPSSPPRLSSCSSCLDAASVHKGKSNTFLEHGEDEEGSTEDLTCEMSLSTLETTEPYSRGFIVEEEVGEVTSAAPRYGRPQWRYGSTDVEGSSSFTELALSSMDMDRHGAGPLRKRNCYSSGTEHQRRGGYRRQNSPSQNDEESYCDGMGESMFGESFALDDGPSFDIEAHIQQRRRNFQASQTLLLDTVLDEDGADNAAAAEVEGETNSMGVARASAEVACP